jgi:hypothetical protein
MPSVYVTSTLGGECDLTADDLGPISPELALVDSALAELGRKALPDPPDVLLPRRSTAPVPAPPIAPPAPAARAAEAPAPLPPTVPRRRRTAPVLAIGFVLGAFFGGLIGARSANAPGPTLAAGPAATTGLPPPASVATVAPTPESRTTTRRASPKQKPVHVAGGRRTGVPSLRRAHPQPSVAPPRATNVLGVEATVSGRTVTLVWNTPADSKVVVVLRARGDHGRSAVVYRGRAPRFRDVSTRSCTAYRYTIVNYDPKGHDSTGVPTSVVTGGCG